MLKEDADKKLCPDLSYEKDGELVVPFCFTNRCMHWHKHNEDKGVCAKGDNRGEEILIEAIELLHWLKAQ